MKSVIKGAGYILAHTPDMVLHNGTTQTTERIVNPESEYLKALPNHLRDWNTVLAYWPNQVYIGNKTPEELAAALQNPEFKAVAPAISKDCLTLVKYKDEGVLPITPEKYKRIMLVNIKGAETPMSKLMVLAMGGAGAKKRPVDKLCDKLNEKGFEAFVYESPLDKMIKQVEAGGKMDLNLYFAGKNAIADFVSGQDLVISFFDVGGGHPTFGLSKGGGEIPWYVHELPVVGISVNKPTMLADIPMLRTYINTYDSNDDTMDALVDALLAGPEAFKGQDPIDAYCGMFDTHM